MTLIPILASVVFIVGYIIIALEHSIRVSKSAVALLMGVLMWILVALKGQEIFSEQILEAGSDIFGIVIFLLAAMSLVEILVHYRFFDLIRGKLYRLGLNDRKQFIIICLITFFLSAILDNLTTTIVMVQISRGFFSGKNLLKTASGVVIAANAGGAFSPLGDVTTIMLWLAHKFTSVEIILWGFLPALVLCFISVALIARTITRDTPDRNSEIVTSLSKSERLIVGLIFLSFSFPFFMSFVHLPPYMGLLLGLAIVWIAVDLLKRFKPHKTHLDASIEEMIKKTDIPSLKFFIGILLAVSALHSLGVLNVVSQYLYGAGQDTVRIILGNIGLGVLSAIFDNVPLTAIAIEILPSTSSGLWVLLALCVGTGGSLLVIGSAAGIVAMGMIKELNFSNYFKIAFVPALVGFIGGILVWYAQYAFFGVV